ncbi:MAG TPA: macro domain-containing protein [Gemmatimonadales bacterium]|nr:macro domain-containing protein [Gemmatimonadales bacterium]
MIQCVVDDLAFVEADAVLRPANDRLEPVTPAAVRLDRQAGPAFASECRSAVTLDAGSAVITRAGELAAGFVLHVILQDQDSPATPELVRRALAAAWRRASEWGLSAVASAPIGSGPGLLDLEDAIVAMAETLRMAPEPRPALTIVLEREADRELADAAIRRVLA